MVPRFSGPDKLPGQREITTRGRSRFRRSSGNGVRRTRSPDGDPTTQSTSMSIAPRRPPRIAARPLGVGTTPCDEPCPRSAQEPRSFATAGRSEARYTPRVLVVATEWLSAHGGLSTLNRHL